MKRIKRSEKIDLEQRIVEFILGTEETFTERDIVNKIVDIFAYVPEQIITSEVHKVLSDLLATGIVKIDSNKCSPSKDIVYLNTNQ